MNSPVSLPHLLVVPSRRCHTHLPRGKFHVESEAGESRSMNTISVVGSLAAAVLALTLQAVVLQPGVPIVLGGDLVMSQ